MPAAKLVKGSGKGRAAWQPGQKAWTNQLLCCSAAKPYLGIPTVDSNTGETSASWEAFTKPTDWQTPENLAKVLTASNCELLNRPGVALSELGAGLETLQHLIINDAAGVFSKLQNQAQETL